MSLSLRFLFAGLVALTFTACQKEMSFEKSGVTTPGPGPGTGGGGTGNVAGTIKMKVNGVQWTSDFAAATIVGGVVNIYGHSSTRKEISIFLLDSTRGTYTLDQNSNESAEYVDSTQNPESFTTDEGQTLADAGGTVTITEVDAVNKTISGTFTFKTYRDTDKKQVVITEGVFTKVPYSSSLPPANSTDTVKAKINAVAWQAESISVSSNSAVIGINSSDLTFSKAIILQIPPSTAPGTYNFTITGTFLAAYIMNASAVYTSQSGQLVILENNATTRRIRGTFNFSGVGTTGTAVQITEGYFSVKY